MSVSCDWVCGDSVGIHSDVEVHDIFTRTQLGVQRDRQLVAVVRLHKDNRSGASPSFTFQRFNHGRGNTPTAMRFFHSKIVDVYLAHRLFKLTQLVRGKGSDNAVAGHCRDSDERVTGKKSLMVCTIRLLSAISIHVVESSPEYGEHLAKNIVVVSTQDCTGYFQVASGAARRADAAARRKEREAKRLQGGVGRRMNSDERGESFFSIFWLR